LNDLRDRLFAEYRRVQTHRRVENGAAAEHRLRWFRDLFRYNYAPFFARKDLRILEIGCGEGYFIKVLAEHGFHDVVGIDLSPQDLAVGEAVFGLKNLHRAGAIDYLRDRGQAFDVIIAKDVLEHVHGDELGRWLQAVARGLHRTGTALLQVPNMDWLMATHERYMDLTHEHGFTRESLAQLCALFFEDVEVRKVDYLLPKTWRTRFLHAPLRALYLQLARAQLRVLGGGAEAFWFDVREIVSVCRRPQAFEKASSP
jgi:2-polyprenyl-3-methyl-5-hydroxy-6-metoxy-1,4-benzoquinol methylase